MTILQLPLHFQKRITVDANGCWIVRGLRPDGYAQIRFHQVRWLAHRLAYALLVGPIPPGLDLDHLCRVKACANPAHLEAVSHRENVLRGEGVAARLALRTRCINDHEYTEANTRVQLEPKFRRYCRACERERSQRRKVA